MGLLRRNRGRNGVRDRGDARRFFRLYLRVLDRVQREQLVELAVGYWADPDRFK